MQSHLCTEELPYTGRELRSHWIFRTFGIVGDAIVSFAGPCEVASECMVDLADLAAGAAIRARQMQHFIVERFDPDLQRAVLHQRLLVALAGDVLRAYDTAASGGDAAQQLPQSRAAVVRRGDDLYVGERKLSVSIATVSPVSALIHLGVNIDPEGAPVPAIGLAELGVPPAEFAARLLEDYVAEVAGIAEARAKVRGVP